MRCALENCASIKFRVGNITGHAPDVSCIAKGKSRLLYLVVHDGSLSVRCDAPECRIAPDTSLLVCSHRQGRLAGGFARP
jgi:hypothetical protein